MSDRKRVTPAELFELYRTLPDDDARAFLSLVASVSTAVAPWVLFAGLAPDERTRFAESYCQLALVMDKAPGCARVVEGNEDGGLDAELEELASSLYDAVRGELEVTAERAVITYKEKREKKPTKTDRDREIVQLRDGRKFSFGRIGHRLGITGDAAKKAYWRYKARSKRPNRA
jgi:hypothetical protein